MKVQNRFDDICKTASTVFKKQKGHVPQLIIHG